MKPLTKQQDVVYQFIRSFLEREGYPPSVREIAQGVGLKSVSTVKFHLDRLVEAGYLTVAPGKNRAITLNPVALPSPGLNDRENEVPLVGHVAAGLPILAEEHVEDYLHFDTQGKVGEHFALRVRGDSMINAGILSDDCVIIHRQPEAHSGEIVVALFEDEATVKTLRIKGNTIWLMPENDAYEPIDGTHAEILGKVVAVVRHYA